MYIDRYIDRYRQFFDVAGFPSSILERFEVFCRGFSGPWLCLVI